MERDAPGLSSEGPHDPLEVSSDDDFLYYLRRGADLLHRGLSADARNALERACELRGDSPKAKNLLGLAYFKLGLLEPARNIYDLLVQRYPHEPALHVNLGLVLLRQGRLDEAESSLRTALMMSPAHTRAHCYLGLALYRRGDLRQAREHFLKGEQQDFARRIEEKLAGAQPVVQASISALRAVADEGLGALERPGGAFHAAQDDERFLRDENGWQTQVGHQHQVALGDLEVPSLFTAPPGLVLPASDERPRPLGSARPSRPPSRELAERVIDSTDLPLVMQPVAVELAARRPVERTTDLGTPRPRPSLIVERGETRARLDDLPPIPLVEPSLRLFADLAWSPGFSTGRELGAQARLVLGGSAYLRRSSIVAGVGDLRYEPVTRVDERGSKVPLGGLGDPMFRVTGEGKLLLRVWHLAAALRDARTMTVVESALVGFEGELAWESRRIRELELLRLEGKGSMLLDCPGAPIVTALRNDELMIVNPEAVLAWTDGVLAQLAPDHGASSHLLHLRGHGLVIIAAPERDAGPQGLVSRL